MNLRDRIGTAVQALRGDELARVEKVTPAAARLQELSRDERLASQGAAVAMHASVLRRQRAYRSAWKGAQDNRLTLDFSPTVMPADDEIRFDIRKLRARARDLARNDSLIRKFRGDMAVNVIGPDGMTLTPTNSLGAELDQATNTRIRDAWKDWSEGPVTVDGRLDLVTLEQLMFKTLPTDGEYLVRLFRGFERNEHGLALQNIDPDYLDENYNLRRHGQAEIRLGVEVDQYGAPTAYHIEREMRPMLGLTIPTVRDRIPADEIVHGYVHERVNQTRGVTWMASALIDTNMLGGYYEAEVTAARVSAAKMGFFVSKDASAGEMASSDAERPTTMDAAPGTSEALPPGWEWQGWDPQHPSAAFLPFTKGMIRRIASGLLVSYNGLANDLEGVNYSSMRSGVISERDFFKLLQKWHIRTFRRRVFYEWLSMSLLTGALQLGTRDWRVYKSHTFTPRGWQWVDPEKEVNALAGALALGVETRTDACAEQGRSFEDVVTTLAAERKMLASKGIELQEPVPPGGAPPSAPAGGEDPPSGGAGDGAQDDAGAGERSLNGHARPANRLLPA